MGATPNPSCVCKPPITVCCSADPVPATLYMEVTDVVNCSCLSGVTATLTESGGHWFGNAAWACGGTIAIEFTCVPVACVWVIQFIFDCGFGEHSFGLDAPAGALPVSFDGDPVVAPEIANCCSGGTYSFKVNVRV